MRVEREGKAEEVSLGGVLRSRRRFERLSRWKSTLQRLQEREENAAAVGVLLRRGLTLLHICTDRWRTGERDLRGEDRERRRGRGEGGEGGGGSPDPGVGGGGGGGEEKYVVWRVCYFSTRNEFNQTAGRQGDTQEIQ